jgi:hypothetical protein
MLSATIKSIMLNIVMRSVVMLNVILLNVVAPNLGCLRYFWPIFFQKKYLSVKKHLSAIHKFDKWTGQEQQFFPTLTFEKVTGGLCYKI